MPDAERARPNAVIAGDKVSAFVAAAYHHDHQLGLLTDVLVVRRAAESAYSTAG